MTLRSASYSQKYTENTPITAVRKVYVLVRRRCLSRPIERGNLWAKSNIDPFSFGVRNAYSAHNQFSAITQAEEMIDRTGKLVEEITGTAEERNSSSAQIRTLFNEQREMIIAECCEKVSHHELQAARAEQERKILQEERIINLQRANVSVFSDSVLCLGKIHQNPDANEAWKNRIEWITTSQSNRNFDGINGEPTEFEWNIFPGFDTLQLYGKVKDLLSRLREAQEKFIGRILFMSMFNDISCGTKDNERECLANAEVVSIHAKKFGIGQWSFIGPGFRKEVVFYGRRQSTRNLGPYRGKDVVGIRRKHMSNFPCNESIVQRSTQKQRTWKTVDSLLCRSENNGDYFSHNCFCQSAQSPRSSCEHV